MKKIIVYGIGDIELRRKIENFMGDDYQIIAYSDSFAKKDFCDGKPFMPPEQICDADYDYLVIALRDDKKQAIIRDNLLRTGIPDEKIIIPRILTDVHYTRQKDLLKGVIKKIEEGGRRALY